MTYNQPDKRGDSSSHKIINHSFNDFYIKVITVALLSTIAISYAVKFLSPYIENYFYPRPEIYHTTDLEDKVEEDLI